MIVSKPQDGNDWTISDRKHLRSRKATYWYETWLNETRLLEKEMKINSLATNRETREALSPQSVVVERVIFVVFALFAFLILIDAALELFFH